MHVAGYYAILDVAGGVEAAEKDAARALVRLLARAERLLTARPSVLQLRAKAAPASALAAWARAVLPLARRAGAAFCVNDRLDLALAVGADAVHLGQGDLPLDEARRLAAGRLAVGISTHDAAQAAAAVRGGADYIGFGPVFGTGSKANPDPVVGLEALARVAAATPIPVVAIGGITAADVDQVAATGAAAAALIAAMEHARDAALLGAAINAAFGRRPDAA